MKTLEINNKHYINAKVVTLATDNESLVFLKGSGLLEYNLYPPLHGIRNLGWKYQHLYITSNEEIKEGDWYLCLHDLTFS